jgi:hypothetical protein
LREVTIGHLSVGPSQPPTTGRAVDRFRAESSINHCPRGLESLAPEPADSLATGELCSHGRVGKGRDEGREALERQKVSGDLLVGSVQ